LDFRNNQTDYRTYLIKIHI